MIHADDGPSGSPTGVCDISSDHIGRADQSRVRQIWFQAAVLRSLGFKTCAWDRHHSGAGEGNGEQIGKFDVSRAGRQCGHGIAHTLRYAEGCHWQSDRASWSSVV